MATNPAPEEVAIPTGRFTPLVSLIKYKWLAVFIALTIAAAGYPIAKKRGKLVYQTIATVYISPKFVNTLKDDRSLQLRGREYSLFVAQQAKLVMRPEVLMKALENPEVRRIWMKESDKDVRAAMRRLWSGMKVKTKPTKEPFMTVRLEGDDPTNLDVVLNEVVRVYLEKAKEESIYRSEERVEILKKRRNELLAFIPTLREQRMTIAKELGVTTFRENALNPYDKILIDATSESVTARQHRVEAEAKLAHLYERSQSRQLTNLDILARETLARDSIFKRFKSDYMEQQLALETKMLNLTSTHPSYKKMADEIAKLKRDLRKVESQSLSDIRQRLESQYQSDINQAKKIEKALNVEVDKQRQKSTKYATRYNEALILNRDIERAYRQLEQINSRIDFLTVESESIGFVRIENWAVEPRFPKEGGKRKILIIFLVLGFGAGLVIPIILDMIDKRLRTPGEIHKILGFPPLAWILDKKDEATEQLAVDQLRRLALALNREHISHQSRCFALTSVKPEGGATTLVLDLAQQLNHLGIHTLALELNAFKPDERYLGANPKLGLSNLLSDSDYFNHLDQLIIPATTTLPDRLPVGETAQRHLVTHGKLKDTLEKLYQHYDFIILDAPPILLSADAELLGDIADGVLLVVEAQTIYPGELKRAAHLLERLSPPVAGAVMNRVLVYKGAGYFDELLKEYATAKKVRPNWLKRKLWGEA